MNSEQAKQLSIPDLMGMWGYEPVKILKNGNSLWYTSPFRKEKDPSFVTTYTGGKCKWIWKDFGDSGGTIIDLVERYQSLGISASLAYLERMFGKQTSKNYRVGGDRQNSLFSFKQQSNLSAKPTDQNFSPQELELKLLNVKPVTNPIIFSYLTKERFIDRKLIKKYLVEVSYDNLTMKKRFFAFGIKNDSNGYEIRSASDKHIFKSSLNAKDITTIEGTGLEPSKINIFEGMTDFLSLLTWYKRDALPSNSIIMNSTNANLDKTLSILKVENYDKINTFFDNDSTGIKTFETIKADFPTKTFSQSHLFAPYTDFNDMLKAKSGINIQRR